MSNADDCPAEVYIYDHDNIHSVIDWALVKCKSYLNAHTVDLSDVSLLHDTVTVFSFSNPEDALLFKLRWE